MTDVIELLLHARPRDLGDFEVRRVLPAMQRRHVGPFVFFDHMGPAALAPGHGMDVRPHPHIGLATVTYLFEGEIDHRDSLGTFQTIRPGDVNWMVAGSGIVHSERSPASERPGGPHVHGIQSWVALPRADEETAARFEHHPKTTLPHLDRDGVSLEVIAGSAYGLRAPTGVLSPTLYVHAQLPRGARLAIDDTHEERAVYVVEGALDCDGQAILPGSMAVLRAGTAAVIDATDAARIMILGGARLDGERHIEWNFVSSAKERIERAKDDWTHLRFPSVPGDEIERIPLPERVPQPS